MTRFAIQADLLALDASNAGEHFWRGCELSPVSNRVAHFEDILQRRCEAIECRFEAKLFEATALTAISTMVDAKRRKDISNAASDAWGAYVRFLEAEAREEAVDFANDMAREVA